MSRKLEIILKDLTQLTFFLEEGPKHAHPFLDKLLRTVAFSLRAPLSIYGKTHSEIFTYPVALKDQKNIFQVFLTLKRRDLNGDEKKYTQWRDRAIGYMLVSLGYSLSETALFLEMPKVHVIEAFYQLIPYRQAQKSEAQTLEITPEKHDLMAKAKAIFMSTFALERETTSYSMPDYDEIRDQFSSRISVNFILQTKKQFLSLLDHESKINR